jgi:anaerobic selenocysteine-containing dehydrogenase
MSESLAGRARRAIRAHDGVLTRDLLREPGGFGLGQVPTRLRPDAVTSMICGFCSTGCSLDIHLRDGQAVSLSPTTAYPVNLGMACPKGWEALTPLDADDRAVTPLGRDGRGRLVPVGWDTALSTFTERFKAVQAAHGPESVAFLSTGQIATEEMALLGALTKFGMGLVHGDGNTRQCMATSVVAYKEAFGFDAPPYTYADFEQSDVIVLVGSNLTVAHPIMWERVQRNPHSPEIIVIDPRRTETAMFATQHVALRPKSDLVLLYGLTRLLIESGWIDRDFVDARTTGFDALAAHVEQYPLDRVVAETGVPAEQLARVARTIGEGRRVSLWWTMGVNQGHQAVRTAQAIINLALITGNIGRPGTGANSITGQCNAMGSRLFSNTASLMGGHDFTRADHRAKVAAALGIDAGRIPPRNSWAYDQIIEGIHRGTIKGLWIIATNTAHSWINQTEVVDLLDKLEFLVVQDLYGTTETAQRADLVLPAAGWGEKEGTFINSERRIGLIKRVKRAPGQALADFFIFKLIAEAWGCADLFEDWRTPEDAFRILGRVSRGQPCDISGLTGYDMIERLGGVQWPYPEGYSLPGPGATAAGGNGVVEDGVAGDSGPADGVRAGADGRPDDGAASAGDSGHAERRLFADGRFFTADGRARLIVEDPVPPRDRPSARYPFVLLTGRGSSSQWHTQTRTAKSKVLRALYPETPYVEINPADAGALGIEPQEWVGLRSRRASMRARAFVTATVPPGSVFVPMHYAQTNRLTSPAFDPYSRQPSYKYASVDVHRLEPWER